MLRERDYYKRVHVACVVCHCDMHVRILEVLRPTTLMVQCCNCTNDIVVAIIPDNYLDGGNQQNGLWSIPLIDLIYLQDGLREDQDDRLLWGNKNLCESRVDEYKRAIAGGSGLSAGSADSCTIPS